MRALRELGVDLAAIRTAIERQAGLAELARTHAEAIDVHVHQLTLRRAVLRALARGISRPEEVIRMNAFARASADEARRVMEEFLNAVFVDQREDVTPCVTRTSNADWRWPNSHRGQDSSDPVDWQNL